MLQFIKELIWPRAQGLADVTPANGRMPLPVPKEIIDASEKLNHAVSHLKEVAVDAKIQSDALHEQITGQPPPSRDNGPT